MSQSSWREISLTKSLNTVIAELFNSVQFGTMVLSLYFVFENASVRQVFLTAAQIGVELNMRRSPVLFTDRRLMKQQCLRIQAHTTPPTFYDTSNGLSLWEPNAIVVYLVMKYGSHLPHLYPENPQIRAKIDQMLYFNLDLQRILMEICNLRIFHNEQPTKQCAHKLEESLNKIENFLQKSPFLVGECLTLADVSLAATITDLMVIEQGGSLMNYTNIWRWFKRCEVDIFSFKRNLTDAIECGRYFELIRNS